MSNTGVCELNMLAYLFSNVCISLSTATWSCSCCHAIRLTLNCWCCIFAHTIISTVVSISLVHGLFWVALTSDSTRHIDFSGLSLLHHAPLMAAMWGDSPLWMLLDIIFSELPLLPWSANARHSRRFVQLTRRTTTYVLVHSIYVR